MGIVLGVSDGNGGASVGGGRDSGASVGGARDGISDGDGGVAGDGASDGEFADAPRRSSRQRSVPDRLTYQQLGGVACHLAYAFVAKPSTILSAGLHDIFGIDVEHVVCCHAYTLCIVFLWYCLLSF